MKNEKSPSYVADLLFIKLPPQIAGGLFAVDVDGNASLDLSNPHLAGYLFHEWIHYVHNTSTLNGLYAFASMINLWANFRHKLDDRGQSVDARVLTAYASASVKRTHLYRKEAARLERNESSPLRNTTSAVTIVSVKERTEALPERLPGHESERLTVVVCEATSPIDQSPITFEVGAVEILEGVAFLLEEKLLMANEELPTPIRTAPYKLLQSLARYTVEDIENDQVIAAGIAALQTDDPPRTLLLILREMNVIAVDARMTWLEELAEAYLAQYGPLILETINKTAAQFPISEPMGSAVKELLGIISGKIALRMRAPFFELAMLKQVKEEEKKHRGDLLGRIIAEYSCPRILAIADRCDDQVSEDQIFHWGRPSVSQEALFGAQKLHAALHYVLLHLSDEGFLATDKITASEERRRCPFYDACTYELRGEQPDICARRPWESLAVPTDPLEACWYRAGVRATRPPQEEVASPA
ncbi:hypothetical protein BJN34_35925 (plasmid) [Cupriavidus necator]|uniref:Uncharacterized protein n=1 Tax=Cupriavidus necator TaxID=106590 RepID=A0A1U9V3P9_CUPNE|nr:hypothetical protein [Cupriavidus necator]AQV99267.1 hypothetical protein BJN34_35925 [Cupriavidus necator]